jgi:hypothetical protein
MRPSHQIRIRVLSLRRDVDVMLLMDDVRTGEEALKVGLSYYMNFNGKWVALSVLCPIAAI